MGLHDSIERFAQEMGWVVKYADDGTPNFLSHLQVQKL